MTLRRSSFLLPLFAFLSARLAAHDYWLEPDRPLPAAPGAVNIRLLVGADLQAEEEREFQLAHVVQCALVGATGRRDLRRELTEGARPFGRVTLDNAGTHLLVMERNASKITLDAAKFTGYLREEGLGHIVSERERRGESGKDGRERYSRFLKCYLRVGGQPEFSIPVADLRLDIAPELRTDRAMQAGDELPLRVNFDGVPLGQAVVFAVVRRADGKISTQRVVTDHTGRTSIKLSAPGLWVVRLVHMRRAPADDTGADWESFWAAATFGVK